MATGGLFSDNGSKATASDRAAGLLAAADYTLLHQLVTDSGWIAPTLAASWTDFGGSNLASAYKKDATGRIWLRGTVKKSSAVISGETLFTLPAGFRPAMNANYACVSNSAFGFISVSSAGVVAVQVGNAAFVNLDGISFDVA